MNTKIFLAGIHSMKRTIIPNFKPYRVLESYMELKSNTPAKVEFIEWGLQAEEFLLDSGAYTFITKAAKTGTYTNEMLVNYIDNYINFINMYDIDRFFEMDIDGSVGYDNVKLIRKYIEDGTNKKVIPVWHITRGMEEFHEMCKTYEFVAVGGIAAKEIKPTDIEFLNELCDIAHSYGCKIHGLGYSPLKVLNERECPFDTIDSTSWIGHRYGYYFDINGNKLTKVRDKEMYWRTKNQTSYSNWVKFSQLPDVYRGD